MTELTSPILIVEDSETQALQLRYLLEAEGWEVVRASTAESALEELSRRRPGLIIADYHLPGMRGDELCRRVRMNLDTRDIPILMLTAEEADGSERAGLDSGADGYVSKSVAPEILLVRVRALLRAASERSVLVSQESHFHRARLLAIDDSPTYLEFLAETLSGEGYDVARASDGEEGLRLIEKGAFDCILVDLVMPDLDGIEVCRRINRVARAGDRSMSIIILTSCETKEDMTRGLEAGADDFVGKSSDITVLKARIRALLRRKFFQEENLRIRERGARLDQLLQSVTVAANRSSTIEQAVQVCLDRICSHTGWPIGHFYLCPNDSPDELISRLWHIQENGRVGAFRVASDLCHFTAGDGLPGRVLASGKAEWIVDLSRNDLPPRTIAAAQAGLRSGFAFPIFVAETVVGVLEFFALNATQPDRDLLAMMGHVGSQLGHVITRQRVEEDLQLAKVAAESANRAKSEFLTTMSHEMRTPLNAILGTTDLLSDSSALDERQRDCVRILQLAGTNLLDLINDILDLAKVESGRLELESIGFDLLPLLEGAIEMFVPRARDLGLALTLEVLPGVPVGLVGDGNRLRQILVNFVGNALKFTEQGSVTLRVEPDQERGASWLRFSVVDTGIGIAAEKVEMIFDRFTQADSSTTRRYGGTGLGLAINRCLVALMGGRIGCSSELGKGSTFFFTARFDIRQDKESLPSVPSTRAARPEPPPGTRILIVEDNEENQWLMDAYLKDSGFALEFAENGKIAVERVINGNPHLVFMDLQMPVMDGLEATRKIRQWEARTHIGPIPILALTAHAGGEGALSSFEAGCNEHLTKPINRATLLEAISRHVTGKN